MRRINKWRAWYKNRQNFVNNSSTAKIEEIKKRRGSAKPSAASTDPEERKIQLAKDRFKNRIVPYTKGPKVLRELTPYTKDPDQDYDRTQGIHAE